MNTLTTRLTASLTAQGGKTTGAVSSVNPINVTADIPLTFGTGNNQANAAFSDLVTGAAGTKTYDLTGGGMVDAFGDALNFTSIKAIVIKNRSASVSIVVTSTVAPISSLTLGPGGVLILMRPLSGWTVTGTSADTIAFAWSGSADFEIELVGTV